MTPNILSSIIAKYFAIILDRIFGVIGAYYRGEADFSFVYIEI